MGTPDSLTDAAMHWRSPRLPKEEFPRHRGFFWPVLFSEGCVGRADLQQLFWCLTARVNTAQCFMLQTKRWGNVEWYHDMDKYEVQARLAAATLFVHWCSENTMVRQKASLAMQ